MTTLYVLAGPTASGKTALSVSLAQALDAEILIVDSRQVYRGMDIGTAKPTAAERERVPHHGLDLRDPDEDFSVAAFVDFAAQTISDIHRRGRRILLVGGTGMYLKALQEGWDFARVGTQRELREELIQQLESRGIAGLVADLLSRDPQAAELVDLNNPARVLRALEIVIATGRPLADVRAQSGTAWQLQGIVLTRPKPELDARIELRINQMMHEGWLDEVRALAARPWPATSPAMTGIGYDELRRHLAGEYTLQFALERAAARTRQYAKRQLTWFRAQQFPFLEVSGEQDWPAIATVIAGGWLTRPTSAASSTIPQPWA